MHAPAVAYDPHEAWDGPPGLDHRPGGQQCSRCAKGGADTVVYTITGRCLVVHEGCQLNYDTREDG